jgi:sec-independent protein translocase protein TatA
MLVMTFSTVFLGFFGGQEIILIVLVILIFFGGRKIPELMKGIGKGIKEFKKANSDDSEKEESADNSNNK